MKISTKGRYALRMITDLAVHQNDEFLSLKDISERQGISKKYLEQIVVLLSKGNLLRTNRGAQGGYRLAKRPDDITVGEILRLTEGSLAPVSCLEEGSAECPRREGCPTVYIWEGLDRAIRDYLDGITVADIVEHAKSITESGDYVI